MCECVGTEKVFRDLSTDQCYRKTKQSTTSTGYEYFDCLAKEGMHCPGRIVLHVADNMTTKRMLAEHNHSPDALRNFIATEQVDYCIKKAAWSEMFDEHPPSKLYKLIIRNAPGITLPVKHGTRQKKSIANIRQRRKAGERRFFPQ